MATPSYFILQQGSGQTKPPGQVFPLDLAFLLIDTMGNRMAVEPVVYSLPVSGASGIFTATGNALPFNTFTDANGICQVTITAGSQLGTWQGLVQASNLLTVLIAYTLTNGNEVAAPTTISINTGSSQMVVLNASYTALTVTVLDQFGAAWPTGTVTFSAPAGHGFFPGAVLSVDAPLGVDGTATSPVFTANSVAGPFTMTATVTGTSPAVTVNTTFTNVDAAVPTTVQVTSGSPQAAALSAQYAQPLTARVLNGVGDPLSSISVLFTAPAAGASCSWPALFTNTVTELTDINGYAATPNMTANATLGSYTVSAAVAAVTPALFYLTNGAAFLPEVCTTASVPTGVSNAIAGSGDWSNLTQAFTTTLAGAYVLVPHFSGGTATMICQPLDPTVYSLIADDAKITKFTVTYEVRSVREFTQPEARVGIYNGVANLTGSVFGGPVLDNVYEPKSLDFTIFSPITGAQLKSGNFGPGFLSQGTFGESGTVYIRDVKMVVCYQNVAHTVVPQGGGLQMCEA